MITEWDQYNNPSKGRYRDPEIALQNLKNSGNCGNKYTLSPFGFFDEKDESGKIIKKIIFPKEYEKRYSKTDGENWQEICYNALQCAANRHFWFLLTLRQKYDLCKFLKKHRTEKMYKMAKASYTFGDLYCDLANYHFTEDSDEFISYILNDNVEKIKQYASAKYVTYGKDYFVLISLEMWNDFTYDKIKDRLIIVDVDDKPIYIHDGQYIINFQDPYGQKGR